MAKECWGFYLVGCIDFCTDYRIIICELFVVRFGGSTFGVRPGSTFSTLVRPRSRPLSREVRVGGVDLSSGASTFSLQFDAGNEWGTRTVVYHCKSVEFRPLKIFTFALTETATKLKLSIKEQAGRSQQLRPFV
jgi:hypothetical protein